uniref:Uncharacterized protein n=1 Tax=Oryza rufipogon TaxID=4529 RepID=A0A0E0N4P0_ORYRU
MSAGFVTFMPVPSPPALARSVLVPIHRPRDRSKSSSLSAGPSSSLRFFNLCPSVHSSWLGQRPPPLPCTTATVAAAAKLSSVPRSASAS